MDLLPSNGRANSHVECQDWRFEGARDECPDAVMTTRMMVIVIATGPNDIQGIIEKIQQRAFQRRSVL